MSASPAFDEVVHAPQRLRICALLVTTGSAEFATVRDALGAADSVTSKHLKVLADAGYVTLSKPSRDRGRPRTWVAMTAAGRRAFAGHLAALQQMAAVVGLDDAGAGEPAGTAGEHRPDW